MMIIANEWIGILIFNCSIPLKALLVFIFKKRLISWNQ